MQPQHSTQEAELRGALVALWVPASLTASENTVRVKGGWKCHHYPFPAKKKKKRKKKKEHRIKAAALVNAHRTAACEPRFRQPMRLQDNRSYLHAQVERLHLGSI
jgi:hypothetical protein